MTHTHIASSIHSIRNAARLAGDRIGLLGCNPKYTYLEVSPIKYIGTSEYMCVGLLCYTIDQGSPTSADREGNDPGMTPPPPNSTDMEVIGNDMMTSPPINSGFWASKVAWQAQSEEDRGGDRCRGAFQSTCHSSIMFHTVFLLQSEAGTVQQGNRKAAEVGGGRPSDNIVWTIVNIWVTPHIFPPPCPIPLLHHCHLLRWLTCLSASADALSLSMPGSGQCQRPPALHCLRCCEDMYMVIHDHCKAQFGSSSKCGQLLEVYCSKLSEIHVLVSKILKI